METCYIAQADHELKQFYPSFLSDRTTCVCYYHTWSEPCFSYTVINNFIYSFLQYLPFVMETLILFLFMFCVSLFYILYCYYLTLVWLLSDSPPLWYLLFIYFFFLYYYWKLNTKMCFPSKFQIILNFYKFLFCILFYFYVFCCNYFIFLISFSVYMFMCVSKQLWATKCNAVNLCKSSKILII